MADKPAGAKKTKKQRKFGRNKKHCDWYKNTRQREKNKLRRAKLRLLKHPNDGCCVAAIARFKEVLGILH